MQNLNFNMNEVHVLKFISLMWTENVSQRFNNGVDVSEMSLTLINCRWRFASVTQRNFAINKSMEVNLSDEQSMRVNRSVIN